MIKSDNIYFRMMEVEDIDYKVAWINDPDVRHTLNFDYPISKVGTENWLRKASMDDRRKDFIICLNENDLQIGYCGFLNIDLKNRKAELYAGIGDKKYWGKGYGQEVRMLQLEYGFGELGLNKLYLYNWTSNEKMIHINKKFGFHVDGCLRADVYSHGEFRDRYIMSLLRKDYFNDHKK